jgi:hypothetical protein
MEMGQFESGISVGDSRFHFGDDCNHQGRNVCPECAGLSRAEVEALQHYFSLLERKGK